MQCSTILHCTASNCTALLLTALHRTDRNFLSIFGSFCHFLVTLSPQRREGKINIFRFSPGFNRPVLHLCDRSPTLPYFLFFLFICLIFFLHKNVFFLQQIFNKITSLPYFFLFLLKKIVSELQNFNNEKNQKI